MSFSLDDIIQSKKEQLHEGQDVASALQQYFDTAYGNGSCKATLTPPSTILVIAKGSALGASIRMSQVQILSELNNLAFLKEAPLTKLRVLIGG